MNDMENKLKELKDKQQEDFMEKLLKDVEWLSEKANAKSYNPTAKEKQDFNKISVIIKNMTEWF